MRSRDFIFFAFFTALVLALMFPAVLLPGWTLANFGDLYAYHYPLRHLAVSSLEAGRLPFWNPYIFCGLPIAANPQTALFYPVSALSAVLPLTLALTWDMAFHWLWGILGMLLLARREGLRSSAAAFTMCLYAFSPFLLYRIAAGIPTLLAALSWAPWCWLASLSPWRGLLAASWALQFLSGHPQFLCINGAGMFVWALSQRERRRLLARFVGEGLGAAALASMQWPMTWQFLGLSVRRDWPQAFAEAYRAGGQSLLTVFSPNVLGNPWDGTFRDFPSVFFESCGLFIGWTGLLAAAAGLLAAGAWRAGGLFVLGLVLACGSRHPMVMDFLRVPARWLFLSLWGLILAAGSAARCWTPRLRPVLKAFVLMAVCVELLAWGRRAVAPQSASSYLAFNPQLARVVGGKPLRILTDPDLANPDKAMLYRAMNVNGYDAFYLAGYPAFVSSSEGRPAADGSRTYARRADSAEMLSAGVAYRLSASGELVPNAGAQPLAYFARGLQRPLKSGVSIGLPRPERWRVEGIAPWDADRLVVSVPSYPGWRAWLGGVQVALEPWGYFQAVRLPQRSPGVLESLVLDFQPVCWAWGISAAFAAWLIWLAVWRRELRGAL